MSTGYAIALKLATGSTGARDWYIILRVDAYQQLVYCNSRLELVLIIPADLFFILAPLLNSFVFALLLNPSFFLLNDDVTDYIIIDGPLRCSSWFSFDVPADPSSSSSACSWFLSYQLIHYAPTGSTWPLPDFEHLT
ncbi:COP-II coat subunit [Dorcoceras hygrometricum]|uniref:COP-II coat subunit n=1 Tax=Dorcoceras hygrometricum TaxID=472368 RepID=A0A2Z7CCJ3_9LAMI|nr:COP-II coat subunit [Dorcoceras hygrometricum]